MARRGTAVWCAGARWRMVLVVVSGAVGLALSAGSPRATASSTSPPRDPRLLAAPVARAEVEPNNSAGTATILPAGAVPVATGLGSIGSTGDVDYWTFVAPQGGWLFAWVDTGGAAYGNSTDSVLTLLASDGTTVVEEDDDDGIGTGGDLTAENSTSSYIAGRFVSAGRYYLRVRADTTRQTINPYHMYVAIAGPILSFESEPNDTVGQADTISTWHALYQATTSMADLDYYRVPPRTQRVVCAFVDGDPDQNDASTDVVLEILDGGGSTTLLSVNRGTAMGRSGEGLCYSQPAEHYLRVRGVTSGAYRLILVPGSDASLTRMDFDRDFLQDLVVWRPSNGTWYIQMSTTGFYDPGFRQTIVWGTAGDVPVAADYDGDGYTDVAVFRPSNGTWYIRRSTMPATPLALTWGVSGDVPKPRDFDGDGRVDPTVFRPATGGWFVLKSSTNYSSSMTLVWGMTGDVPVPADHDGDGRADFAVWRPSTGAWYRLASGMGHSPLASVVYGTSGDIPVFVDLQGFTLQSVYRPSTSAWYFEIGSTVFGVPGDVPVPGDFTYQGISDLAVWRPSTGAWYVAEPGGLAFLTRIWGTAGDIPIGDGY